MKYNVTVIGSGPGGYVAAIRCAQLGMKTALIEKYDSLGGTCLNVGCIPSKALLDSSEHYHNAIVNFSEHGIKLDGIALDLPQMIKRKNDVVKQTSDGVGFLMKKNNIDVYHGIGSFKSDHDIAIKAVDGSETKIHSDNIIIATGSKPAGLPFIKFDKKRILTSTEALNLSKVPNHLIVIGGGVIGVEIGSVFARLGAKVSIVEFLDGLIPTMDRTMGKELQKSLKKLGFEYYFNHKVTEVTAKGSKVHVKAENKTGNVVDLDGDYCLVSIGRKPYTEGLNLEKAGVKLNERGQVEVDDHLRTNKNHI